MQLSIGTIQLTSEWTQCVWRPESLRHVRDRMLVVRDGVCGTVAVTAIKGEEGEEQELTDGILKTHLKLL